MRVPYTPTNPQQNQDPVSPPIGETLAARTIFNINITEWEDFLRPELRNKLVLTYPNDDDAVLYAFDLV